MSQHRVRFLPNEDHIAPTSTEPSATTDGVVIKGADTISVLIEETGGANTITAKLWLYWPKVRSDGNPHGWQVFQGWRTSGSHTIAASGHIEDHVYCPGATRAYLEKDAGSGTMVCAIEGYVTGGA